MLSVFKGRVKKDLRTKNLVKRLKPKNIALISHPDLDRITAESLVQSRVRIVINTDKFISGKYPNKGPLILASNGIFMLEGVGREIFGIVKEGETLKVENNKIIRKDEIIAEGIILKKDEVLKKMKQAEKKINEELGKFAVNTLTYIKEEKDSLFNEVKMPKLETKINGKHVLVVVRGYDYKEDLKALQPYIRDIKPVIIGVDGGADALKEFKLKPDVIIGDMDSISDKLLKNSKAEIIVHAYSNGLSPGMQRVKKLGLSGKSFLYPGTSEDIALLLAYESNADLIVAVGTHMNLVEFLDKGRKGMASTFLVRLKVGEKIMDAKGVSKLYQEKVKISHLMLILFSTMLAFSSIALASPWVRDFLNIIVLKLRILFGI
ncbi:MAG: hypothetical protein KAS39_00010 [Actinomycetia bacterium]|nr:hypothetical protein [Actinomycetes bacterium]